MNLLHVPSADLFIRVYLDAGHNLSEFQDSGYRTMTDPVHVLDRGLKFGNSDYLIIFQGMQFSF